MIDHEVLLIISSVLPAGVRPAKMTDLHRLAGGHRKGAHDGERAVAAATDIQRRLDCHDEFIFGGRFADPQSKIHQLAMPPEVIAQLRGQNSVLVIDRNQVDDRTLAALQAIDWEVSDHTVVDSIKAIEHDVERDVIQVLREYV